MDISGDDSWFIQSYRAVAKFIVTKNKTLNAQQQQPSDKETKKKKNNNPRDLITQVLFLFMLLEWMMF